MSMAALPRKMAKEYSVESEIMVRTMRRSDVGRRALLVGSSVSRELYDEWLM